MSSSRHILRQTQRRVASLSTPILKRTFHSTSAVSHSASATSSSSSSPFSLGSLRIRASVARGATTPLSIESVHLRLPRSDEVLVRLVATGLCHTDVAVKERGLCSFPMILGHEGAGIIERVGSSITNYKVGDHVLLSYASCGQCPHCALGKPAYCYEHGSENFGGVDTGAAKDAARKTRHVSENSSNPEAIFGSFFRQSSFATYALATPNNLVRVNDKSTDLAMLAPLGCGIQTGAGAILNTLQPKSGSSLAVFGLGAVGLSAIMAARLTGVKNIVAVDRNPMRVKLAKELGADHGVVVTGKEVRKEMVEHLRSFSSTGLQYSLDTSGNPEVLRTAFDALDPLGTCGLIGGAAPGVEVKIDMLGLLPGKQLRGIIQGDAVPSVFLPQLMEYQRKGLFPFEKMLTYYDGLEMLNQAIDDCKDPTGKVIKPVVRIAAQ